MKKLMLLLVFALASVASLSGMNPDGPCAGQIPQQEPQKKSSWKGEINQALADNDWSYLFSVLDDDEWCRWKLFNVDMNQFKLPCRYDSTKPGLFEVCLQSRRLEFAGHKSRFFLQLIINGLDIEIKKDGRYVFEQYGERFLDVFEPIAQCNFKKPLSAEFKAAYTAYKLRCATARLAVENKSRVNYGLRLRETKKKEAKEKRALLLQKIKMPALYCGIGVAVLAVLCLIYKKYVQKTAAAQNDEEVDENQHGQQEAGELEITQAQSQA